MSPRYRIQWEIDIEAPSAHEAAEQALEIHRDPESTATVFEVTDEQGHKVTVDLMKTRSKPARAGKRA